MGERRLAPRVEVDVPAQFRQRGLPRWQEGLLLDVSVTGTALMTSSRIPLQQTVGLRFSLPGDSPAEAIRIETETLVVRTDHRPDLHSDLPHFHGLFFLDLAGEPKEQLERFVEAGVGPAGS